MNGFEVANILRFMNLVRNARFEASAFLVWILWFSRGIAVPMGKLQNPSCSKVLKDGFPLFRVADVTFHDMCHNASKIGPCDMRMLRRR